MRAKTNDEPPSGARDENKPSTPRRTLEMADGSIENMGPDDVGEPMDPADVPKIAGTESERSDGGKAFRALRGSVEIHDDTIEPSGASWGADSPPSNTNEVPASFSRDEHVQADAEAGGTVDIDNLDSGGDSTVSE